MKQVTQPPSYYWQHNCFGGRELLPPERGPLRYDIGVDKIMWGQDYPHTEGTYPYTTEALRNTFAGLDVAEVAPMVGLTAIDVYGFDLDLLEAGRGQGRSDGRGGGGAARAGAGRLALDRVRRRRPQALVSA